MVTIIKCDNCNKELDMAAIKIECWYNSKKDVTDGEFIYEFCSDECVVKWVNENL